MCYVAALVGEFAKAFGPLNLLMREMSRYLLFVNLPYAYPILRPLQAEILRRGGEVAWFVEKECPDELRSDEIRLGTVHEVIDFNPVAVFTPGNYIPHFFPGVKVALFHGYPINKRNDHRDDHFTIRGWFDLYCTQGPSSTLVFEQLERKCGFFRVYETGWPKADIYFSSEMQVNARNVRPTVLYSSTFTRSLTSAPLLAEEIERLLVARDWNWIFMFHPKLTDPDILDRYKRIATEYPNTTYVGNTFDVTAMHKADVMLCDSSSIILEFMFLDKPVVTFRNSHPGPYLIDVRRPEEVGPALERALTRPDELMREVRTYTMFHEPHRDCRCSARVLDAVDDFLERGHVGLKRKPLNLIRKWKMRRKFHYWPFRK